MHHGEGVLDALKGLRGKKTVICIGGGSIKNGYLDAIDGNLKEAGFETKLIEGVESDPSVSYPARLEDHRRLHAHPAERGRALGRLPRGEALIVENNRAEPGFLEGDALHVVTLGAQRGCSSLG